MKSRIVVILLIGITLLSGCAGSKNGSVSSTGNQAADISGVDMKAEQRKQEERAGQTLWFRADDKGNKEYLPDTNSDVIAVRNLMQIHSDIVDNRDYRSVSAEGEYALYTKGFRDELKNGGYGSELKKMYEDNEIVMKQTSMMWQQTAFSKDMKTCNSSISTGIKITSCKQSYMDAYKLKLDTEYTQTREYHFTKEDNEWKISDIGKSGLTESESIPKVDAAK